ncbi:MAG: DNA repair protein RecO [Candidatus Tectomicrobia bacterium]|uniref:DNA repair protein RecO n=1 Tax=Tectimicrobiota bacterium TaxID=2528274 RepID=A0A932MRK0_UNCTE|nr:DNA repair protein RecO [Candidatus Tectomicrobia bacterium]
MGIREDEAVVLGAAPYSNTSLIVSLLTRGAGKVRLVAKGVRSPKSRVGVGLEPATRVHLEWFENPRREMGTLRKCETIAVHRRLWEDLEAMRAAGRMLGAVDRVLGPHEGDEGLFGLLGAALGALDEGMAPGGLEALFPVVLLQALGLEPALAYCPECAKTPGGEAAMLDAASGELRCRRCPLAPTQGIRLRAGAIATLQEALRLGPKSLRSLQVLPSLQPEVRQAAEAFLAYHTGASMAPRRRGKPRAALTARRRGR